MRLVTPLEMMKLEEQSNQSGVTYDTMMEAAGTGLAVHLAQFALERSITEILFLCGNGNNAGDCFVAAGRLSKQFTVKVCMVSGVPRTRTAYTKFRLMRNVTTLSDQNEIREAVKNAPLVVDGIFGIGFRGELSPFVQELFGIVNSNPDQQCIAVDIPSGGSGLNGTIAKGTPRCNATVTFGAAKTGQFLTPLSDYCGAIFLVEIGIPEEAFAQLSYPVFRISDHHVRDNFPPRPVNAHKGMFGKLLSIVGCRNMPGAAMLSTQAALRCGVGLSVIASDADVCRMTVQNSPESMMLPLPSEPAGTISPQALNTILEEAKSATCVLIGCGLGQNEGIRKLIAGLIPQITCPIVLDADGLNSIAGSIDILHKAKAKVILTPHPGEMSRLLRCSVDDVQKDRLGAAKRLASRFPNTIVVLKGAGTVVAVADHAYVNTTGNSGMSKGGSGDVLAGMIASFTAQHIDPEIASRIGVYVHGLAGDCAAAEYSRRCMLPSDIIRQLPLVLGEYE